MKARNGSFVARNDRCIGIWESVHYNSFQQEGIDMGNSGVYPSLSQEDFLAAILGRRDPPSAAALAAVVLDEGYSRDKPAGPAADISYEEFLDAILHGFRGNSAAGILREYNFNPDEPRDWRGRWTTGGSDAGPGQGSRTTIGGGRSQYSRRQGPTPITQAPRRKSGDRDRPTGGSGDATASAVPRTSAPGWVQDRDGRPWWNNGDGWAYVPGDGPASGWYRSMPNGTWQGPDKTLAPPKLPPPPPQKKPWPIDPHDLELYTPPYEHPLGPNHYGKWAKPGSWHYGRFSGEPTGGNFKPNWKDPKHSSYGLIYKIEF
jgi:hypothetical protein